MTSSFNQTSSTPSRKHSWITSFVPLLSFLLLLVAMSAHATSPFCGDGVRGTDFCDGTSFPPGFTDDCASWGLGSGTVSCTAACVPDFSGCTSSDYCQASGFYSDGICDSCELWGGIPDPDCQQCFVADGQCIEYLNGVWTCQQSFAPDPDCTCGDGVAQGSEPCDGADLKGNSCQSWGYAGGGTLYCLPNCDVDFSGCFVVAPPVPSNATSGLLFLTIALLLTGAAATGMRAVNNAGT